MTDQKDWNAIFTQRMSKRNQQRSEKLNQAKAAAKKTSKESFNEKKFKKLYIKLNPYDVDEHTPWDTLLKESEYEYYVSHTEITNMKTYIEHLKWEQGWG